ncbi:serine/threonine-protein kinase [Streptosporangium saharense]|uniref:serine/threonine-protein kinase n=1 Tax=Streptosporangium saharense TaxID=1706840 RepID=UPI003677297A
MNNWVIPSDRYRTIELLGSGGMAEVWLAEDVVTGEKVVVKYPRPDLMRLDGADRAALIKRFAREVELLKRLNHRGIPRWRHDGGWPNNPWVVMDHVDGMSLHKYTGTHGVLPVAAAAAIMVDLLEILGEVHPRRLVHRDIKPSNIYIDRQGRIHLLDFGIAFDADPHATRITQWGSTPGSPGYMSPEALRNEERVTAAADIYSCGCLLFRLLTGQPPFPIDYNLNHNHLEVVAPRISERNAAVPAEIDDLVAGMLEKNPLSRPPASRVEQVMRAFLPIPGSAPPDKLLGPGPSEYRRGALKETPARAVPGRSVRRRFERPGRAKFQEMIRQARQEVSAGDNGVHVKELRAVLTAARKAWGHADLDVAKAQVCCADAELGDGNWVAASGDYRAVIMGNPRPSGTEMQKVVFDAVFGRVECLLAEDREAEGFQLWADTTRELKRSDIRSRRLTARRDYIAAGLSEVGFTDRVKRVLEE